MLSSTSAGPDVSVGVSSRLARLLHSVSLRCSLLLPSCSPTPDFSVVDLGTLFSFLCPHRPPVHVQISQSLIAVKVARSFGCFTASTAGRSDAPRCRRHFLLLSNRPTSWYVVFFSLARSTPVTSRSPVLILVTATIIVIQMNRTGY